MTYDIEGDTNPTNSLSTSLVSCHDLLSMYSLFRYFLSISWKETKYINTKTCRFAIENKYICRYEGVCFIVYAIDMHSWFFLVALIYAKYKPIYVYGHINCVSTLQIFSNNQISYIYINNIYLIFFIVLNKI